MTNTVTCDKCGNIIEVDRVLEEQLRHKIADEERGKLTKEIEEKATNKVKAEMDLAIKRAREEVDESRGQNKKLQGQLEELLDELRQIKREKDEVELAAKKKLIEEEEKIKQEERKRFDEEHRLKDMEMEKKMQDVMKANDELRRKLEQGSQQTQGEVQELDLENALRGAFPQDIVEPVAKGVTGADIKQVVRSPRGIECGIILWESKRTKVWSGGWIPKLKEDKVSAKANICTIVSEALPEEAKSGIGRVGDVWICTPKQGLVLALAELLRQPLLDVAYQKVVTDRKQDSAGDLYDYITSKDFENVVRFMLDTYNEMATQIEKERVAYEKSWSIREAQLKRLRKGVSGIYGSLHGAVGKSLPPIESLELEGGEEQTKLL